MDFFDLKTFKISEVKRYSTLVVNFQANKYLDMPMSEGAQYISDALSISYKASAVFTSVVIDDFDNCTEDDFITICDNFAAALLENNCLADIRSEDDKKKIMNKLPSDKWVISKSILNAVNVNTSSLYHCGNYMYKNRLINLEIRTKDSGYKYQFLTVKA